MKTILLVDDEVQILEVLTEILTRFGYKVISRLDARSALSVIHAGTTIDLVITDYRMPGMNGAELIISLRKLVPAVPVIMLTGFSSVELYLQSLSLGAYEHLNKPIKIKDLLRVVKAALARDEQPPAAEERMNHTGLTYSSDTTKLPG
jgi:DNA-binding NtrC family response regulator